jgi:hypothetical protein
MRTLAMPKAAEPWSLTSLREKLIKIGAKVVRHGRYVTFHMWTGPSSQGVLQREFEKAFGAKRTADMRALLHAAAATELGM